MAKTIRRMLATVLVMCMFASALPMQALAAERGFSPKNSTSTSKHNFTRNSETAAERGSAPKNRASTSNHSSTRDGVTTNVTSTVTTTPGENGAPTVVVETTETTTSGTDSNGVTINAHETTTTTTTYSDSFTQTETTVEGSEKKEWTENDAGNEPGQPKVDVDLIPGETTTGTASNTTVEGSISEEEGQTTTTTTDRTVTATTTDEKVEVTLTDTSLEGLQPELKFDRNSTTDQKEQKKETDLYTDNNHFTDTSKVTVTDPPEDYPFKYVGYGDYSGHYVSHIRVIYERDEAGNPLKDENGEYIIKELQHSNGTVLTKNGVPTTDLNGPYDQTTGTRPTMFMLMNEEGDAIYGYCIDLETPTATDQFYQIGNLEDNDYYASEEAANHVRNIAMNGYWGTAEGTGSIEKIREDLKAAVAAGTVEKEYDITFVIRGAKYTEGYELQEGEYVGNGYICKQVTEHIVLTDEIIDAITEGEAMDATQSAIWSYANGAQLALDGNDGMIVGDLTYASSALGDSLNKENDYEGAARTLALYNYLVNLDAELESTTVINNKNNVENMQLTIGDKVFGHENNLDTNQDNDVYHAEMKFTLAFTPNSDTDDLLVYLTDGEGNTITDANGNDIVKRLAGTNTEERSADTILPDENGVYTLTGLQLSENEDQTFSLRLEGSQYLEQGVYIYTAEGGIDASQTMVGVVEGTNTVDISKSVTFNFDVDEKNHVVQERVWNYSHDPIVTPQDPTPTTPPTPDEPAPLAVVATVEEEPVINDTFRLNNQEEAAEEIPEEPVPLAAPVITGDNSGMWIAVMLLAIFAMVAINLFDKKRQHETF